MALINSAARFVLTGSMPGKAGQMVVARVAVIAVVVLWYAPPLEAQTQVPPSLWTWPITAAA
jgi:hypothetical protein